MFMTLCGLLKKHLSPLSSFAPVLTLDQCKRSHIGRCGTHRYRIPAIPFPPNLFVACSTFSIHAPCQSGQDRCCPVWQRISTHMHSLSLSPLTTLLINILLLGTWPRERPRVCLWILPSSAFGFFYTPAVGAFSFFEYQRWFARFSFSACCLFSM